MSRYLKKRKTKKEKEEYNHAVLITSIAITYLPEDSYSESNWRKLREE